MLSPLGNTVDGPEGQNFYITESEYESLRTVDSFTVGTSTIEVRNMTRFRARHFLPKGPTDDYYLTPEGCDTDSQVYTSKLNLCINLSSATE